MKFAIIGLISIVLILILSFAFVGDGSTIHCKNTNGGIVFSYDPLFNTVDINGYPTFKPNDPWVDFITVSDNGFIIVYSQDTYDPAVNDIRAKQHVYRYQADTGLTSWYDVPSEDASRIQGLDDTPSQQAASVFDICDNQIGGGLIRILAAMKRA